MSSKKVVVTGLGALTPIGNSVPVYWENLLAGVSGANPITHFNPEKFKTRFACELKDFNALDYIDAKEARKMDSCTQYALVAATEAIKDSGIDTKTINMNRAGIIIGTGVGGLVTVMEPLRDFFASGEPRFSPFMIPKVLGNMIPGILSMHFGFHGPNYTTTSACASSANAIADAYHFIKMGKADIMLAGGSEACISEPVVGGFNAMHALSTRNDDYKTASRPFDLDRDGFVIAEGAGILLLEDYDHAIARGAKIYAELGGVGLSADAYHITAPHPEGRGSMLCMQLSVEDAGLQLSDIDHVNTHGTSTPPGDVVECKAIQTLFGDHAPNIAVNALKSMTGHLLGAAAAVEGIAAILAIKEGIIPPTINQFTPDPNIPSLDIIRNKAVKRDIKNAISNSFGFGGQNASILFKKYES